MKKRKKQQMKSSEKKSNYSKPSSKIIVPKSTKYNYQYSMPNGEIAKTVKFLLNEFEMKPIQHMSIVSLLEWIIIIQQLKLSII